MLPEAFFTLDHTSQLRVKDVQVQEHLCGPIYAQLGRQRLMWCSFVGNVGEIVFTGNRLTRRPASADRTARRQFQATGQPVCHFCPSLWTDKSGQCRLFFVHRISLFLLLFAHKRPSPFFYICPTKKPYFKS